MIFGFVLLHWTSVTAIDHILVPDLPAEVNFPSTQHKYFTLTISIDNFSDFNKVKRTIEADASRKLSAYGYGVARIEILSNAQSSELQLRIGFLWKRLYNSNVDKAELLDQLRNIDFVERIGGRLIDIEGEALCPDSYCILGENTICQEDLEDFRPLCVSPCKLSNFCSSSARCLHSDEKLQPRCFCLGAISSVTFGSRCQYSLPLIAILLIAAFVVFMISLCIAISFRYKYGRKSSPANESEFRSEVDERGQASVSIQPTMS